MLNHDLIDDLNMEIKQTINQNSLLSAFINGMISNFLEWNEFGSTIDTISSHQELAVCIDDPFCQGFG